MKHGNRNKTRKERFEDFLRPKHYLGYDYDRIAIYLLNRRAYTVAEGPLKRAVWLNPYEPIFKLHLAICLYKQNRYIEAKKMVEEASQQGLNNEEIDRIKIIIETNIKEK